jgi:hypothetical protein
MSPEIPSGDDFLREANENNRRNNLPAKVPTKHTAWILDRAWVDDQKIRLGMTVLECQVDEWEEENERILQILHDKGEQWSDLYNEIACDAVGDARENARSPRFL